MNVVVTGRRDERWDAQIQKTLATTMWYSKNRTPHPAKLTFRPTPRRVIMRAFEVITGGDHWR